LTTPSHPSFDFGQVFWYHKDMTTAINKKMRSEIKMASKVMGIKEEILYKRALAFYLNAIKDKLALKKEFDDWDKLSDEAFLKMGL
jgi:hypothetical protein